MPPAAGLPPPPPLARETVYARFSRSVGIVRRSTLWRMSRPLRIWTNANLSAEAINRLREALGSQQTLSIGGNATDDPALLECDIAFGQPDPDQLLCAGNLKWVQIASAGYSRYEDVELGAKLREHGVIVTNSSSVTDEPCAQHLLAMMLALSRQLPQAAHFQQGRRWAADELMRGACLLGDGQTALLLGFGAIARRLVELLAPLRMRIIAMRREIHGDEPVDIVTSEDVNDAIARADHVVNILPRNSGTEDFVDTSRLQLMKRGAAFYNVGRGATVDQAALIEMLRDGRLRGAYLDVTDPEPLPSDHPLWSAPNCFITPHIAAVHRTITRELIDHFAENFRRFLANEALVDRVI